MLLSDRLEEYLFDEMELKYQVPQPADQKSLDVTVPRMFAILCVCVCLVLSMLQDVLLWILCRKLAEVSQRPLVNMWRPGTKCVFQRHS